VKLEEWGDPRGGLGSVAILGLSRCFSDLWQRKNLGNISVSQEHSGREGVGKILISKKLNDRPEEEFEFKGVGRIAGGMGGGKEAGFE